MDDTHGYLAALGILCTTAISVTIIVAHYCFIGVQFGGSCG